MNSQCERIRLLNDQLRRDFSTGQVVITRGVAGLGAQAVAQIIEEIATYDKFTEESDPHGEGDFGCLELEGRRIFFKIDYFDLELSVHSPDPADASVTSRVMTVLLDSEY